MAKKHMKRIAAPRTWPIERKKSVWVTRPNPGAHSLDYCMPLGTVLTELIKCAKTKDEIKKLLGNKEILIDGKRRKDPKHPVGFMDVIEIIATKENYRMLFNSRGKIIAKPIEKDEAGVKLCKIRKKTMVKGKKIQLNLSDGRNILASKGEYNVGDTLLLKTSNQEIKEHLKLEDNVMAYLTGGKHMGEYGFVEGIKEDKILFKSKGGEKYETLKDYAFVIGKDKPLISMPE